MPDLSDSLDIAAPPATLYAMVSDLTRMRQWSPENTAVRWVGRTRRPTLGARFIGTNRYRWLIWWTVGRIVVADPGRQFAFTIRVGPLRGAYWEYRFEATDNGTRVTESWTDQRSRLLARLFDLLFGTPRVELNRRGIHTTLERLKASAEAQH